MPQVCVSRNLTISGGALGLAKWSAPRMVAQVSATSTGDGAITGAGLTTQPGRLMVNAQISWVSDSPLDSMMRLQVIRPYRTIIASNPNAVQIWDAWNHAIDRPARVPDAYNLVNSLCTLGVDIGTDNVAQPVYGRVHQDYPASASEEWYELPAGSTLNVHYRAYVWTPPPWSNNASANNPLHEAHARGVKLRLWAFPTADQEVR
ncbi:DUF7172 family protein [Nocardia cyriacigeorgica]|uniref:DUF7172 family protein n=1 Tax=Nocardia cyriacigeorgica TaxID=135487 RepID=UPI002455963E|nr:hypothetical protein [Nocardia cyriacigeorgica]